VVGQLPGHEAALGVGHHGQVAAVGAAGGRGGGVFRGGQLGPAGEQGGAGGGGGQAPAVRARAVRERMKTIPCSRTAQAPAVRARAVRERMKTIPCSRTALALTAGSSQERGHGTAQGAPARTCTCPRCPRGCRWG
jgi:hypothetical protein